VSFIFENISDLRPSVRKPTTFIVKVGDNTSSIIYNNSNDGPAIASNIKAGTIVHTNSIIEPCVKYL
jgi:hypothetical protein